jgi:hypothetical protein
VVLSEVSKMVDLVEDMPLLGYGVVLELDHVQQERDGDCDLVPQADVY